MRPGRVRLALLMALVPGLAVVPRAAALEFANGRVQIHGFVDNTLGARSNDWSDDVDLVQWMR